MTTLAFHCLNEDTDTPHACASAVTRLAHPDLTVREVEVLVAWVRTESKGRVGRQLFIAPCTVNTHLERVRAKYAAVGRPAHTKAALTARAIQDGLVCLYDL